MENQNQYEEISLIEVIVMWLKNWRPAVCCGMLVIALGVLVVSLLTPKYDSTVDFQVGKIGEDFLISPAVFVAQLKAEYRVGDDTQGVRPLPRLEKVSGNKRDESPVVKLTARAKTAEEGAEFLSELTQGVIESHLVIYQKNRAEKQALYEQLNYY